MPQHLGLVLDLGLGLGLGSVIGWGGFLMKNKILFSFIFHSFTFPILWYMVVNEGYLFHKIKKHYCLVHILRIKTVNKNGVVPLPSAGEEYFDGVLTVHKVD